MLLKGATYLNENFSFCRGDVEVSGGKITRLYNGGEKPPAAGEVDVSGCLLLPGLFDVHIHGIDGVDVMDADLEAISKSLAARGTTSFLATTMTQSETAIHRALSASLKTTGARAVGFHMEGPYLSAKYKGAQPEAYLTAPNIEQFMRYDSIKMVTVAPELSGAMEFIEKASQKAVVSLGHSDADYDTAAEAMARGARCVTHLFNAMAPFGHRSSNILGAAAVQNCHADSYADSHTQCYAQLICDGVHVQKGAVWVAYKVFGPDRLVLISDSMEACGLADGTYQLGGQEITVSGGVARTASGAIAGSCNTLWQDVKQAAAFGIPLADAVKMASLTPCRMMGIKNRGAIAVGFDADLLVADQALNLQKVMLRGRFI